VIGVVGTEEKAKLAREHGCADVLMSGKDDIAARVRALTAGRGVDVVYDSVGKATFAASLDSLAPRGMLVAFGNASGRVEPFDPLLLSQKGSLYLTRPTLGHYIATTDELRASASALFSVIQRGAVRVVVGQRFPLAEVAAAHRALEGRATVGSTLLTL